MRTLRLIPLLCAAALAAGCYNPFSNPFDFGGGGGGGDDDDAQPARVVEATDTLALAVGGVAPGRDELLFIDANGDPRDFGNGTLACEPDDDILIVRTRPDFETAATGSGVQLVATAPGITAVRCTLDDAALDEVFEITVPPQSLIQILIAEAGGQLADEAQLDPDYPDDEVVLLASISPTGDAIGAVIRNRIDQIEFNDNPALFNADEDDYDRDPPASYYDAVILAENQFSPTDPDDPTYETFSNAQDRNFLEEEWLVAYDQAVLTAAAIFNGDAIDPTVGAFAFRSPTESQWASISHAQQFSPYEIPEDAGFTDASFPAYAPIQLLIHPDVWRYEDGRPAFVFARERQTTDYAITTSP